MKLKLIAVAVMSLSASASFAQTKPTCGSTIADITHINWCAPEATLFIAGSSALKDNISAVLPDLFDISTDGSKKFYKITDASPTGAANQNKSGTTAWYGTSKTNLFGTQKRLLVVYNNNNGSGAGVSLVLGPVKSGKLVSGNPVESNVIYVGPTKNIANTCSLTTESGSKLNVSVGGTTAAGYVYSNTVTCTNTADIPADLAISDVRAQEIYKFYSNVPKTVKFDNYSQVPLGLQGFGLVVNWTMYKALQDAQATAGSLASTCSTDANRALASCQPSVRSVDYASLVKNGGTKSAAIFGLSPLTKLTLVRRDDLSGTQSASNIYFLRNSCDIGTTLGGGVAVLDQETDTATFAMTKKPTSGSVRDALGDTSSSSNAPVSGYAIGALSLSNRSITADSYNFVKIDGMAPTVNPLGDGMPYYKARTAIANGDYNFAMTAYGIYNKSLDSQQSDKSTLVNKVLLAMRDSTRHDVTGIAYLDGVPDTKTLMQSLVNHVDGNNCGPILKLN